MRIPTWRLALTGAAVTTFAVVGIGLVAAASAPPPAAPGAVAAEATRSPDASAQPDRPARHERLGERRAGWGPGLLRIGRHLVHAEATVVDRDGNLILLWLDHGTVASVARGSLTISEAGGGSKTVVVDEATIVYVGRVDGTLADVTAGDEVFVQSRVDGGTVLAKRILIVPARPG